MNTNAPMNTTPTAGLPPLAKRIGWLALGVAALLLAHHLRGVLLPFLVAWLLAYLLYPLVHFLQHRCRLRYRVPSIILALALVAAIVAVAAALIIPPTLRELAHFGHLATQLAQEYLGTTQLTEGSVSQLAGGSGFWSQLIAKTADTARLYIERADLMELMQRESIRQAIWTTLRWLWSALTETAGLVAGLAQSCIVALYTIFILADYESLGQGLVHLVPRQRRPAARQLLGDVERAMSQYFRAQALIALIVGILFATGFAIIRLPAGVALGLLIGLLNLVPYLQLLGIPPTLLCALMRSAETGESFWWIALSCALVFATVQTIQDTILTPAIMGKRMGLKPALILLSLSVWGSLMGVAGLIIALPLTTLLHQLYRRHVLHERPDAPEPWPRGSR